MEATISRKEVELSKEVVFTDIAKAVNEYSFPELKNINAEKGFFIYIPKNAKAEQINNKLISESEVNDFNLIIVDDNASLTLVNELISAGNKRDGNTEIILKKNSSLNLIEIQNFDANVGNTSLRHIKLDSNSNLNISTCFLGSKTTGSFTNIEILGENASLKETDIFFGNKTQNFSINTNVIHAVPNTNASISIKGILKDEAHCFSKGLIKIEREAKKTVSSLKDHILLLSKDANADAIPALDVDAADVQARHSASVSQIDNDQIFYLVSRGLNEDEAKKIIALGFISELIEDFKDKRDSISELLEEKWSKN